MSEVVKGLADAAENAAEAVELLKQAKELALKWGREADGYHGVAVIMAANLVEKAVVLEVAEGCECTPQQVMATVMHLLVTVTEAG